jgi:hypothetical protein
MKDKLVLLAASAFLVLCGVGLGVFGTWTAARLNALDQANQSIVKGVNDALGKLSGDVEKLSQAKTGKG